MRPLDVLPPGHWFWNLNYSYPITCACLRLLKCACAIMTVTIAHIAATFAIVRTMYMVNNDYDKFRSFSRLYRTLFRHRTCTHLHGGADRFLVSVSNGQVAALGDWAYYQWALVVYSVDSSLSAWHFTTPGSVNLVRQLEQCVTRYRRAATWINRCNLLRSRFSIFVQ